MKLIDYSDSDASDSDGEQSQNSTPIPHSPPPAPKPHHAELPKKPAKRQIVVDLPKPIRTEDEPKPKRVKTEGSEGSGLFSMLPPPKRSKPTAKPATENGVAKDDGVKDDVQSGQTERETVAPELAPAPVKTFMPRSAQAKKGKPTPKPAEKPAAPAVSLFPLGPDLISQPTRSEAPANPSTYEPLITHPVQAQEEAYEDESFVLDTTAPPPAAGSTSTLSTADLDTFAAHILEGRHRKNRTIQIMDYNAAEVYAQNAADKAAGVLQEQIAPVRAIGSGRHQLTQLLNNVQDQKESLEEQFAKNRRIKKESAAKYGW
jgi:Mitotic checkpoint regulator, MAD2B-interacting